MHRLFNRENNGLGKSEGKARKMRGKSERKAEQLSERRVSESFGVRRSPDKSPEENGKSLLCSTAAQWSLFHGLQPNPYPSNPNPIPTYYNGLVTTLFNLHFYPAKWSKR